MPQYAEGKGLIMKNGYFQLVCGNDGTALRVYLPQDGGEQVKIKEVMEYLNRHGIQYDLSLLNQGLNAAAASGEQAAAFKLNATPSMEVREEYMLVIDPDRMKLTARFYPPSEHGERMTVSEFLNDMVHRNVKFGVQKEALTDFFLNPRYCEDIVVAQGKMPVHGEDDRIEYYFETDLRVKPTLNEDGSVDFFHLNTINHCKKDEVLAKLFPGSKGEAGMTVMGEIIKPRDVKHYMLKYGNNISISADKQTLTSQVDGHVTLVEGKVFVSNVLEVENVDTATGNIDYDGSVRVNGNVRTNFSVKAKGDIEVRGVVEGAYLEAEGNIIIARGMNGMQRGTLKAGGNVIAKFLESAKVTAGGYVSSESILHSEVMAETEVTVTGRKGFITGGKVCAKNLVQVKTLGSNMGADTIIEVGADPAVKLRVQELQKRIVENKKANEAAQPILTTLTQKLSQGVKLQPAQVQYFQEVLQADKARKKQLEEDMQEIEGLQVQLEEGARAAVEVTGEVYAGTIISIGDVSMTVKNTVKYCRFVKSQGDVKIAAL